MPANVEQTPYLHFFHPATVFDKVLGIMPSVQVIHFRTICTCNKEY